MVFLKYWRRKKLDRRPFPKEWKRLLENHITPYRRFSSKDKGKLERLILYFLKEKSFEGCGGFVMDEEKKLLIASMSCIPLMGGVSDIYPLLRSVLVYPSDYEVAWSQPEEGGVVTEGVDQRSGESWDLGVLVYSWDKIEYDLRHPRDGSNVIYHECAHQLDYESGITLEPLRWGSASSNENGIAAILKRNYQKMENRYQHHHNIGVDAYALTNIHEFFAVMSETWFESPGTIKKHWPEVYEALVRFYRLNPYDLHRTEKEN